MNIRMMFGIAAALCCSLAARADSSHARRLEAAGAVFREIMAIPDRAIPQDLLDKSHCVVLIPGLKKGAFIFGGKYGRGFLLCRKEGAPGWTGPAAVRMEGGSVGFQIGGKEADVVLLVMNERGVQRLMSSKFTLGGEASAAAGPVGRTATAQTDAFLTAEILSWSRSRGAFAGISLQGATLRQDLSANRDLYGQTLETREIIQGERPLPEAAKPLVEVLNKYSPRR